MHVHTLANKGRGYSDVHLKGLRETALPTLEVGSVREVWVSVCVEVCMGECVGGGVHG